jgi:hypothetical protein
LVGARSPLSAATNPVEAIDDVVNLLTCYQSADALQVAVAATDEIYLLDDIIVIYSHIYEL